MTASTTAKGREFETSVASYYETLGYGIRQNVLIAGQQVDIVATLRLPDGQSHVMMIECKYHEDGRASGNQDVQSIAGAFAVAKNSHRANACVVVTSTRFSPEAKEAAAAANIHLLTADELIRLTHRIPLAYAVPMQLRYARARVNVPYFVHGHGRRTAAREELADVSQHLESNAESPDSRFTLLFGGVGTGKTTQLMALSDRLTSRFLAGANVPIGIFIPLERFTRHRKAQYFDDFVIDYLRSQFRMPDVSWSDVAQWLSSRTAVLLLDGFDEIAGLDNELAISTEFDHIAQSVGSDSGIMLSCRTTLAARSKEPLPELMTAQLAERGVHAVDVIELSLLAPSEVTDYIDAVGVRKDVLAGIAPDVLRRPLLLSVVVKTLDGKLPSAERIENTPALLEHCVTFLLKWRMNLRQASITDLEWRTFLEECALQMMLDETKYISTEQLREMVVSHFGAADDIERLRKLEFDASVRTVLDFDLSQNGLRWTHAIFRDFLAAGAIARHLVTPRPADASLHDSLLTPEEVEFVQYHVRRSDWRPLKDFRRPAKEPEPISSQNRWRWVSPGLSLINDLPDAGGRLIFFDTGFWVSEQPITIGDLDTLGAEWMSEKRARLALPHTRRVPVTYITHEEASKLAEIVGARLPTENEWERAARWVDGSFPRPETLPGADESMPTPPSVSRSRPNPWGIKNAVGCVWQWTSTYEAAAQRYVCRGLWWGARMEDKLEATHRLLPREPDHIRTGVRFMADPVSGGGL